MPATRTVKWNFKHIFVEGILRPGRKTPEYGVVNHRTDALLGWIEWYSPWQKFCFWPEGDTVWSTDCLADVQAAIKRAEAARKDEP